jgi:GNAT superfamily N-acetyltransferase
MVNATSSAGAAHRHVTVRPATPDDAPGLSALQQEAMEIYRVRSGIAEGVLEALSEKEDAILHAIAAGPVFAAEAQGGELLGTVRLLPVEKEEVLAAIRRAYPRLDPALSGLYYSRFAVRKGAHGHGIGNLLYAAALDYAKSRGAAFLCLHTSLRDQRMTSFYERRGFVLLSEDNSRGYPRGLFVKLLP